MPSMILKSLRLSADAADGGGTETKPAGPAPETKPDGTPPEKSHIAVTGQKSEREIELETALDNERARADEAENGRKKVETEHATLRDDFDRYKKTVETKPEAKRGFRLPTVLD